MRMKLRVMENKRIPSSTTSHGKMAVILQHQESCYNKSKNTWDIPWKTQ